MPRFFLPFIAFLLFVACSFGQTKTVSAGIEYKPIFPVGFLRTGTQTVVDSGVNYAMSLKSGFNAGMVIRKGFTKLVAAETGISYVKRRYELDITDSSHRESSQFRIIGYEIPLSVLVYIRLGEIIYMNASMGVTADMFASNVQSFGDNHRTLTVRNGWIQPAINANIGWEIRTANIGYFYLGSSFHGPFQSVFTSEVVYNITTNERRVYMGLSGNYLTFDIRYFFPPEKPKPAVKNDE